MSINKSSHLRVEQAINLWAFLLGNQLFVVIVLIHVYYCVDVVYYSYGVNGKAHTEKFEDIPIPSKDTEFEYDFHDKCYECLLFSFKKGSVKKNGENASR